MNRANIILLVLLSIATGLFATSPKWTQKQNWYGDENQQQIFYVTGVATSLGDEEITFNESEGQAILKMVRFFKPFKATLQSITSQESLSLQIAISKMKPGYKYQVKRWQSKDQTVYTQLQYPLKKIVDYLIKKEKIPQKLQTKLRLYATEAFKKNQNGFGIKLLQSGFKIKTELDLLPQTPSLLVKQIKKERRNLEISHKNQKHEGSFTTEIFDLAIRMKIIQKDVQKPLWTSFHSGVVSLGRTYFIAINQKKSTINNTIYQVLRKQFKGDQKLLKALKKIKNNFHDQNYVFHPIMIARAKDQNDCYELKGIALSELKKELVKELRISKEMAAQIDLLKKNKKVITPLIYDHLVAETGILKISTINPLEMNAGAGIDYSGKKLISIIPIKKHKDKMNDVDQFNNPEEKKRINTLFKHFFKHFKANYLTLSKKMVLSEDSIQKDLKYIDMITTDYNVNSVSRGSGCYKSKCTETTEIKLSDLIIQLKNDQYFSKEGHLLIEQIALKAFDDMSHTTIKQLFKN